MQFPPTFSLSSAHLPYSYHLALFVTRYVCIHAFEFSSSSPSVVHPLTSPSRVAARTIPPPSSSTRSPQPCHPIPRTGHYGRKQQPDSSRVRCSQESTLLTGPLSLSPSLPLSLSPLLNLVISYFPTHKQIHCVTHATVHHKAPYPKENSIKYPISHWMISLNESSL